MSSRAKRTLSLVAIAFAAGLALFWWRGSPTIGTVTSPGELPAHSDELSTHATSTVASVDTRRLSTFFQSERVEYPAQKDPAAGDPRQTVRNAPASEARDHLEAEAQLLAPPRTRPDGTPLNGIDVKSSAAIMKDEEFDRYMDALAEQASKEPLAMDLTELYSTSANDAAQSAEGVAVGRVVCGMKLCLASVTAPSRDAFAPWLASFLSAPSAHPYSLGRYDNKLPDGTIEIRMTFSTDPSINSAYGRPGK